jgi:hypothetical protein
MEGYSLESIFCPVSILDLVFFHNCEIGTLSCDFFLEISNGLNEDNSLLLGLFLILDTKFTGFEVELDLER